MPEPLDANANAVLTMAEQRNLEKRQQQDHKEIKQLKQDLRRKKNPGGLGGVAEWSGGRCGSTVDCRKKNPGLLGRGRGRLTTTDDRRKALQILGEGIAAHTLASELAKLMGVGLSTLQHWRK